MSPSHLPQQVSETKHQRTWLDLQLPDLRALERSMRACAVDEIASEDSHAAAIELTALHLGLDAQTKALLIIDTPLGGVQIDHGCIAHIVDKRKDARERYAKVALDTLTGPFEIWKVAYSNNTHRLAFIGVYEAKRQMLVVVALENGKLLWNYMQCDAKSLNKHRHGELLYKRYELMPGKEKATVTSGRK